ncbi:MAG: response regulator transcription factor [Chloroflexi bacterium]|nr:MAG: response regulator transcription factor [Chloroflexota bacterium]
MARVLVVEDEVALNDLVRAHLEQAGHTVCQAHDGHAALRAALEFAPELVVLDWMLPGLDGLSVCRELRRHSLAPIIMLTARHDEADRVTGLEVGADDYVVKPFSAPELVARVRAMLRRVALDRAATRPVEGAGRLVCGPLVLDATALTATVADFLIDRVWGADYEGLDRAVDSQMVRLRRKLGAFGQHIEAVWGLGYRLRPPAGDPASH